MSDKKMERFHESVSKYTNGIKLNSTHLNFSNHIVSQATTNGIHILFYHFQNISYISSTPNFSIKLYISGTGLSPLYFTAIYFQTPVMKNEYTFLIFRNLVFIFS